MLPGILLRGRASSCSPCVQALLAGWASACQQLRAHSQTAYPALLPSANDGSPNADETYHHWRGVWRTPKQRAPPAPRGPSLEPEERALLESTLEQQGLPRRTASHIISHVERGVLPLDPLALASRIRALSVVTSGSPALLLATQEGPALLSVDPQRLERQVKHLQALLPEYRPEQLLGSFPRWALHGPGKLADRLREVEEIYRQQLGVEFPRGKLFPRKQPAGQSVGDGNVPSQWGQLRQDWWWIMALTGKMKLINTLELIMLAGPQAASQLLMTCPHIMSVFPDRVAGVVEAAAPRLGVSSQEVLGLFVKRPEVLMRHPEKVKESAGALVQLLGGNKAAAVQLLKKQPSLLLFTSEGLEANMRVLRGILGKPKVSRLLPILLDAPNLLTRSHSALEAAWTTLHGELGLDAARALLFGDPLAAGSAASPDAAAAPGDAAADLNGAGGDVCGGAPRLLAYSKEALVARIGMLRRLRELSDDWKERVDDVMGHTGQLGAVLGAPQRAFERLSWLEESKMTRAPGGMRLVDLMTLGDVAFRDLYPSWPGAGEGAEAETGR